MHSYLNPCYVYVQTPHSNAGDKQTRHELEGHENGISEEEEDIKKILKESSKQSRNNEKYVSVMKEQGTLMEIMLL